MRANRMKNGLLINFIYLYKCIVCAVISGSEAAIKENDGKLGNIFYHFGLICLSH